MSTKPSVIDEFGFVVRQKLRSYWPIRTIAGMMIVIGLIAISLAALPSKKPAPPNTLAGGPRIAKIPLIYRLGSEELERAKQDLLREHEAHDFQRELLLRQARRLEMEGERYPTIDDGMIKVPTPIDDLMIHQYAESGGAVLALPSPIRNAPDNRAMPPIAKNPKRQSDILPSPSHPDPQH